jgi:hypothetical protein
MSLDTEAGQFIKAPACVCNVFGKAEKPKSILQHHYFLDTVLSKLYFDIQ